MPRPDFRFRLNGIIIPEIRVQRALVKGKPIGPLQIAVRDPWIGWFTIDDNAHILERSLPQFILEYRDETAWSKLDPLVRRLEPRKGWQRVSPRRLIRVLREAGYIQVDA